MFRFSSWLVKNRTRFFGAVLIFLILTSFISSSFGTIDDQLDYYDLWVEFNGLILDVLLFGILLTLYDSLRERNSKVERWKEELDDFRGWQDPEAQIRVRGLLRRLSQKRVSKIDLSDLHFDKFEITDLYIYQGHAKNLIIVSGFKRCTFRHFNCSVSELDFTFCQQVEFINSKFDHVDFTCKNPFKLVVSDLSILIVDSEFVYSTIELTEVNGKFQANFKNCLFQNVHFKLPNGQFNKDKIFENCSFKDCKGFDD